MSWLEWYETPVKGAIGLPLRSTSKNMPFRVLPSAVIGRPLLMLPSLFLLARLPALVALNPPADFPLMILWLVAFVLEELVVAVL